MTNTPWFKFYPSDFLAGTSGLTAAERGVYITVLALMYEYEGEVKLDHSRLARRCGVPSGSFKKILAALLDEGKLIQTDTGISNERAMKEIADRQKHISTLRSGAAKTNAIKAEKRQQKQGASLRLANADRDAYQIPDTDTTIDTDVSIDAEASKVSKEVKALWDRGVPFLVECGTAEKSARSLIGKWIKDYGGKEVFEIFKAAKAAGTGDPVSYITKGLKSGSTNDNVADMVAVAAKKLKA